MNLQHRLACVGKFGLYADSFVAPKFVYLKFHGADSDGPQGSATLQIPAPVWEKLRQQSTSLFDLADLPDEELRKRARERAAKWNALQRLLKPYPTSYKTLLGLKRTYRLLTDYDSHLRELRRHRETQLKLRESLEELRTLQAKKTRSEK